MPAEFHDLLPDFPVVELVVSGSLVDPESIAVTVEAIAHQRVTGITRLLCDCRDVRSAGTILTAVQLADSLAERDMPVGWRQALVRPLLAEAAMVIDLWGAAAANRGADVRVFRDRESALAWLVDDVNP